MKIKALIIAVLTIFTVNNASAQKVEIDWQIGCDFTGAIAKNYALCPTIYGGISINEKFNFDIGVGANGAHSSNPQYGYELGIPVFAKATYYPILTNRVLPYASLAIGPNISKVHTGLYFNTTLGVTWYLSRIMGLNFGIGFYASDFAYNPTTYNYDHDTGTYIPEKPAGWGESILGVSINVGIVFGRSKFF